ncbi:MAG: hypothetical protein Q4C45_10010 [Oscillospiraceae bacterium]|nr:hypothetical protein [Oscillospiraceae bacterium]
MLALEKEDTLFARNIPFGLVEVWYPDSAEWDVEALRALEETELAALRERCADYDRRAVFGENPYVRFFKKFKKTYPVLMQVESFLLKGRPFPQVNPVTEVPFLAELTTQCLMGTHDADAVLGTLRLFSGTEKAPFTGLRGGEVHTYPNDVCGRDDGGIILSMIAGADDRTCAKPESRHVFYPVFGTPDMPTEEIASRQALLRRYVLTLAPAAKIETQLI